MMNAEDPTDRVRLLHDPDHPDGAAPTFDTVERSLREARRRVEIHMYVWRSDAIGNRIGEAVLAAADRGVSVHITKDVGAFMFERIEMNRKSFFNLPVPWLKRLTYRVIAPTFPNTYVEDTYGFELGRRIMAHPNVDLQWVNKTHTKYYLFDEERLVLGSINLEDRHRGYCDYMIEMEGVAAVDRFRKRMRGEADYDAGRPWDFLCNTHRPEGKVFEIRGEILRRLRSARDSVYVEMAYVGDPTVTRALAEAARRGVRVTVLLSEQANIGNDVNYRTLHRLYRQAPIEVYLSPRMVHAKLMLFDEETVLLGSCNLSVFSLRKAAEMDVVIRCGPELLASLRAAITQRLDASRRVGSEKELEGYRWWVAGMQQLHQHLNPN